MMLAPDSLGSTNARAMALLRLRGALDAAMRGSLSMHHLVSLADRIQANKGTTADRALLAAFDAGDLKAAMLTAFAFVIDAARPFRAVSAVIRPDARAPLGSFEAMQRSAATIASTGVILRERLHELPDDEELSRIGRLFERGNMTPGDLAVIRALPGPYMRSSASQRHYAIFVDYRLDDGVSPPMSTV